MMNQRMIGTLFCFSILCLLTIALVSCVQPGSTASSESGVQITLHVEPDPPIMGESELIITLKDEDGVPITDAVLNVQGDMTHAGMAPVIRDVEGEAQDGLYRVPFEWSMAGDWIVTVIATLNDGTEVEQMFDLSVTSMGEGEMTGHDSTAKDTSTNRGNSR